MSSVTKEEASYDSFASTDFATKLDETTPVPWMEVFYNIMNLPKWCFSNLGTLIVDTALKLKSLNKVEEDNFQEVIDETVLVEESNITRPAASSFIFPTSLFDDLVTTLFSHYPATLTVGPLSQDLSIVSLILISTFIGCLTSTFFIYLHDTLWCLQWHQAVSQKYGFTFPHKGDMSRSQSRGSLSLGPDIPVHFLTFKDATGLERNRKEDINNNEITETHNSGNVGDSAKCLELHQFSRGKYSPCFDMQGMRVETLLRLLGIHFQVYFDCDNSGPWIVFGDDTVWGYHAIRKYLTQHFFEHMSHYLVPKEYRIRSHLINLHVEHEISWLLYHWRWYYGINRHDESFAWSKIPQEYVDLAASSWNRKLGNVTINCLVDLLDEALNVISELLDDNDYFIEDTISEVDVSVFSVLSQALWAMPMTTVEGLILGKPNLVSFCQRVRERCWKDWDKTLGTEDKVKIPHDVGRTGHPKTYEEELEMSPKSIFKLPSPLLSQRETGSKHTRHKDLELSFNNCQQTIPVE